MREAIEVVHGAGVSVKMVTGDAEETATAIASRLGLFATGGSALSGPQVQLLTQTLHPAAEDEGAGAGGSDARA